MRGLVKMLVTVKKDLSLKFNKIKTFVIKSLPLKQQKQSNVKSNPPSKDFEGILSLAGKYANRKPIKPINIDKIRDYIYR